MTPPTPTAFETRNVGTTLEAEATLGEGKAKGVIWLRFTPEVVANTGNIPWLELKDRIGNKHEVLMPAFYLNRMTGRLTMRDGKYVLAGAMTPRGSEGEADYSKKWMVFVKVDVL